MIAQPLQPGDRVVLRRPWLNVPDGTIGTIIHIYPSNPDYCQVRFDQSTTTYPIPCEYLAKIDQEPNESAVTTLSFFYQAK